jgi:hypothetical protein
MSKIFEALQFAQTERLQQGKLARQVPTTAKVDTQVLEPGPVSEAKTERADRTACNCEQWSHRIRRQGIWHFLLGLLGLYPWKCSHCHRHFHRLQRY